jgi:hypothetical protein
MSEEVQLSLQDVAACVHIIDIVSKRGAFEGAELGDVGAVRNKLAAFIEANKPSETAETVEDSVESDGE